MFRKTKLSTAVLAAFGGALVSAGGVAQAQEGQNLERITITGSNIRRVDAETPSPVQVITAEDLQKSGYTRVAEVLQAITANGQGTLSQGFSGAFATGGSGIALRGLTVGATLVLIDGHRMAPYPIGDDGQRSFVDISAIPFDAVERIEVLKDGASAVYGSDAIAGVVNVILKRSFVGKTLSIDAGTSSKRDGSTVRLSGSIGFGDLDKDGQNFYFAGEGRKQKEIRFSDRGGRFTQTDFTSTGGLDTTFGVPNTDNGGLPYSRTGYVTDVDGNILGFLPGCDAASFAAGKCGYSDTWSQIQPETENYNFVARYTKKLSADWQTSVQASYFQSKAQQVDAPSTTFPGGRQGLAFGPSTPPTLLAVTPPTTIPGTNPSLAGTGIPGGILYYQFLDIGRVLTESDAKSTRLIADLTGQLGAWDLSASVGLTRVDVDINVTGAVQADRLQAALDSTTDPYIVGGPNSASVLSAIAPDLTTKAKSELSFFHLGVGRDLFDLSGGPLAIALGVDYIYRKQNSVAAADVAAGLTTAASNNFTIGKQNVASAYAELVAPLTKQLETEAAIRYDRYNISGGKASPKVGFKYTPLKEFAVRGTAGKGFRAPGPAENGTAGQTYFATSFRDDVLCPNDPQAAPGNFPAQCSQQIPTAQGTTKDLKPEVSTSYTFGLILEPTESLNASIDFYSIEIKNQIIAGPITSTVRGSNFSPIPQNQPDGTTTNVAPPVAPIAYLTAGYINANSTKTTGVDVDVRYKHKFEEFNFDSDFTISYIKTYDITQDGITYKLAGTHAPFIISGATGLPKTRFQWSNTVAKGPWSLTGTLNYLSSFDLTDPSIGINTCLDGLANGAGAVAYQDLINAGVVPDGISCKVKAFKTFDVSGRYDVSKQLTLTASILNLFNAGAPEDWLTYGGGTAPYNPSFHSQGAIGRYFTLGARLSF